MTNVVCAPDTAIPSTSTTRVRQVPGEPGIWVLIFGDILVFTVLFVAFLVVRAQNEPMFTSSQDQLSRTSGAVNTLVLLTSSILVVFGTRAFRNQRSRHLAPWFIAAGAAVGSCFVLIKFGEYHTKTSAGLGPSTNEFFMYYYALTGLHLLHVVIGLVVLAALWRLARQPTPTPVQMDYFEGGACFWHMVDLLWLVIFPLVFLVR